jgi:TRAP-type C4-dicarboxylate transport system permease small subunit
MKLVKILLFTGLFLLIGSFATCYFGVQYAESQISPEIRSKMTDTDWIGIEWIGRGLLILLLALITLCSSLFLWLRRKYAKTLI